VTERSSFARAGLVAVVVAIGAGALLLCLGMSGGPSNGPSPIVWDEEVCAECRMHVGDPRFAAQLRTRDDDVHNFDDPGCLIKYVQRQHPELAGVWFHHSRRDRWLDQNAVRFLTGQETPMGYGLAAVDRGVPGAIDYRAAARVVRSRGAGGGR